jgi:hypothetical protein
MLVWWTKIASWVGASADVGVMKPNPFLLENHLTVPVTLVDMVGLSLRLQPQQMNDNHSEVRKFRIVTDFGVLHSLSLNPSNPRDRFQTLSLVATNPVASTRVPGAHYHLA